MTIIWRPLLDGRFAGVLTRYADDGTLVAIRRFCRQWPEGPQPTDEGVTPEQEAMRDEAAEVSP